MSEEIIENTTTNSTPDSTAPSNYSCPEMWSIIQEHAYERLSKQNNNDELILIEDYAVRARRIAATYARFYLETERGGDPTKKGRYYWMALGAFASKTVACTLELKRVKTQGFLTDTVIEGLGKGNFWLFQDISAWHWYYSLYGDSFDLCAPQRNVSICVPQVTACIEDLPWASDALPKINQLQITDYVKNGFAKVKEIETMDEGNKRRSDIQLEHLNDIANHEQLKILQPLIYDDPDFAAWVKKGRWPIFTVPHLTPELRLAFSSACDTEDTALKSIAPKDTKLENAKSRMLWIADAAKQFNKLMQTQTAYMEGELQTIASWYNMADKA